MNRIYQLRKRLAKSLAALGHTVDPDWRPRLYRIRHLQHEARVQRALWRKVLRKIRQIDRE